MSHEETFMNCATHHRFYLLKKSRTKHFLKRNFYGVISDTLSGDFSGLYRSSKKLDIPATLKLGYFFTFSNHWHGTMNRYLYFKCLKRKSLDFEKVGSSIKSIRILRKNAPFFIPQTFIIYKAALLINTALSCTTVYRVFQDFPCTTYAM